MEFFGVLYGQAWCVLVAAPSFTVDLNPRLESILRFRSTVNEASFDLGIAVVLVGGIIRGEPMRMSPSALLEL